MRLLLCESWDVSGGEETPAQEGLLIVAVKQENLDQSILYRL